MKKLIALYSVTGALAASLASLAHAGGEGAGVRGGGSVVPGAGGSPTQFASLVTPGTCRWLSAEEVMGTVPALPGILSSVENLDWYFASSIREELGKLRFCMTDMPEALQRASQNRGQRCGGIGSVENIVEQSLDSGRHSRERLIAFREDDVVYLDESDFNALDRVPLVKAQLLIHEAAHSYFEGSLSYCQRQQRLRSLDGLIDRVHGGAVRTRERFHFEMNGNQVRFPLTVSALDPVRTQVEFILAPPSRQKAMVLASPAPESLIAFNPDTVRPHLAYWHQGIASPRATLLSLITQLMVEGSVAEFQSLLTKSYSELNPISIALSVLGELQQEKRRIVLNSQELGQFIEQAWNEVVQTPVSQRELRIVVGTVIQEMGAGEVRSEIVPLTSITPRSARIEQRPMSTSMIATAQLLASMVIYGQWDQVDVHFAENAQFYNALGLKSQKAAVAGMTTRVRREQALALSVLDEIRDGAVEQYFTVVRTLLTLQGHADKIAPLMARIHMERFR